MTKKVAIQGFTGSYHDKAARIFYANDKVETIQCDTFKQLLQTVSSQTDTLGAIAIENTIAGSLLQNYDLIRKYGVYVNGEHKLRIKHSFAAMPGQKMEDIKEVHSHYMALLQCEEFLQQYPHIKLVESEDTAKSAYEIAQSGQMGVAAICAASSARDFGLEVLHDGIETNKHNFTRFLMISGKEDAQYAVDKAACNKAMLVFSLLHETGSLSKILTILSFYNINLTKIESRPIVGSEWEYLFYIDVMFDDYHRYRQSIDAILPLIKNVQILGEFQEGSQTID